MTFVLPATAPLIRCAIVCLRTAPRTNQSYLPCPLRFTYTNVFDRFLSVRCENHRACDKTWRTSDDRIEALVFGEISLEHIALVFNHREIVFADPYGI